MSLDHHVPAATTDPPLRWKQYLCWIAALSLLLYATPFLLVRAPLFERWSTSPYGRDLEYGMTASHVDADVVIYGDSSAMYGIDPRQMSAALGVKVFSIPNVLPSLLVTRDMSLQRYLKANKPPRLILIYLSLWNLNFSHLPVKAAYDGDEMLLRHGNARQVAQFYKGRLPELLQFPFQFYRVNSPAGIRELLHPHAGPEAMAVSLGHKVMQSARAMDGVCTLPAISPTGELATQTAQKLRARYETAETRTLIYIAPIPECENASTIVASDFSRIGAAPPRVLPREDFANDTYYAHPLAAGVTRVTSLLIEAIRPLLMQNLQASRDRTH